MSKNILIASGSKSILTKIKNKYPEHHLYLYKSITERNYKLIDWFTNHVIFKSPLSYHKLISSNVISYGPFINLIFLTLDHKQQNILLAYIKKQLTVSLPINMTSLFELQNNTDSSKIILGTVWKINNISSYWNKRSFITNFIINPNNTSFHNNLIKIR